MPKSSLLCSTQERKSRTKTTKSDADSSMYSLDTLKQGGEFLTLVDIGESNVHKWNYLKHKHRFINDAKFVRFLLEVLEDRTCCKCQSKPNRDLIPPKNGAILVNKLSIKGKQPRKKTFAILIKNCNDILPEKNASDQSKTNKLETEPIEVRSELETPSENHVEQQQIKTDCTKDIKTNDELKQQSFEDVLKAYGKLLDGQNELKTSSKFHDVITNHLDTECAKPTSDLNLNVNFKVNDKSKDSLTEISENCDDVTINCKSQTNGNILTKKSDETKVIDKTVVEPVKKCETDTRSFECDDGLPRISNEIHTILDDVRNKENIENIAITTGTKRKSPEGNPKVKQLKIIDTRKVPEINVLKNNLSIVKTKTEPDKKRNKTCLNCNARHGDDTSMCQLQNPLLAIEDAMSLSDYESNAQSKSFAECSLPHVCYVKCVDEKHGLSVFVTKRIDKLTQFGPLVADDIKGVNILDDCAMRHIWEIKHNNTQKYKNTENGHKSNWFRFVRPAESHATRNVTAITKDQQLFLITVKDVDADEELRYWLDETTEKPLSKRSSDKANCGGCSLTFDHPIYYRMHCSVFHDLRFSLTIRKYHCKVCEEQVLGKDNIVKHAMQMHNGDGAYQCQFCNRFFLKLNYLDIHRSYGCASNPHRTRPLCDFCGRKFCQPQKLKVHIKRMHKDVSLNEFKCHVCSKLLSSPGAVQRHAREVHRFNDIKTIVASKTFEDTNGDVKKEDILKEVATATIACTKCSKIFQNKSNLKIHMLTHSGIKPFKCNQKTCTAAFTTKQCLQNHYKKQHKFTEDDMPKIERSVEFTFEAYCGQENAKNSDSTQLHINNNQNDLSLQPSDPVENDKKSSSATPQSTINELDNSDKPTSEQNAANITNIIKPNVFATKASKKYMYWKDDVYNFNDDDKDLQSEINQNENVIKVSRPVKNVSNKKVKKRAKKTLKITKLPKISDVTPEKVDTDLNDISDQQNGDMNDSDCMNEPKPESYSSITEDQSSSVHEMATENKTSEFNDVDEMYDDSAKEDYPTNDPENILESDGTLDEPLDEPLNLNFEYKKVKKSTFYGKQDILNSYKNDELNQIISSDYIEKDTKTVKDDSVDKSMDLSESENSMAENLVNRSDDLPENISDNQENIEIAEPESLNLKNLNVKCPVKDTFYATERLLNHTKWPHFNADQHFNSEFLHKPYLNRHFQYFNVNSGLYDRQFDSEINYQTPVDKDLMPYFNEKLRFNNEFLFGKKCDMDKERSDEHFNDDDFISKQRFGETSAYNDKTEYFTTPTPDFSLKSKITAIDFNEKASTHFNETDEYGEKFGKNVLDKEYFNELDSLNADKVMSRYPSNRDEHNRDDSSTVTLDIDHESPRSIVDNKDQLIADQKYPLFRMCGGSTTRHEGSNGSLLVEAALDTVSDIHMNSESNQNCQDNLAVGGFYSSMPTDNCYGIHSEGDISEKEGSTRLPLMSPPTAGTDHISVTDENHLEFLDSNNFNRFSIARTPPISTNTSPRRYEFESGTQSLADTNILNERLNKTDDSNDGTVAENLTIREKDANFSGYYKNHYSNIIDVVTEDNMRGDNDLRSSDVRPNSTDLRFSSMDLRLNSDLRLTHDMRLNMSDFRLGALDHFGDLRADNGDFHATNEELRAKYDSIRGKFVEEMAGSSRNSEYEGNNSGIIDVTSNSERHDIRLTEYGDIDQSDLKLSDSSRSKVYDSTNDPDLRGKTYESSVETETLRSFKYDLDNLHMRISHEDFRKSYEDEVRSKSVFDSNVDVDLKTKSYGLMENEMRCGKGYESLLDGDFRPDRFEPLLINSSDLQGLDMSARSFHSFHGTSAVNRFHHLFSSETTERESIPPFGPPPGASDVLRVVSLDLTSPSRLHGLHSTSSIPNSRLLEHNLTTNRLLSEHNRLSLDQRILSASDHNLSVTLFGASTASSSEPRLLSDHTTNRLLANDQMPEPRLVSPDAHRLLSETASRLTNRGYSGYPLSPTPTYHPATRTHLSSPTHSASYHFTGYY